jgi:hypothetical protein
MLLARATYEWASLSAWGGEMAQEGTAILTEQALTRSSTSAALCPLHFCT